MMPVRHAAEAHSASINRSALSQLFELPLFASFHPMAKAIEPSSVNNIKIVAQDRKDATRQKEQLSWPRRHSPQTSGLQATVIAWQRRSTWVNFAARLSSV
jgi:hypothetical protein